MTTTIQIQTLSPATKTRKMVFTFAIQLAKQYRKAGVIDNFTWSQIMRTAWSQIQANNYRYVEFTKTDGSIGKYVILNERWSNRFEVKGTGTPISPDRVLMIDAVKSFCGLPPTISTYKDRIRKAA